ncbi:hypothetical protein EP331_03575 [bacterium]|nr:MAG: hypothetical protein EP331_03575 [bacterium]
MKWNIIVLWMFLWSASVSAQQLDVPIRQEGFLTGSALAEKISFLPREEREAVIFDEFIKGNVPDFLRKLVPISIKQDSVEVVFYVTPDYLCLGKNGDFIYVPLTPITAQKIATALDMSLPTTFMVDNLYEQAAVKLRPQPIPPSDSMTSVSVFLQHQDSVLEQRAPFTERFPLGRLTAGHKKDVIISNRMVENLKTNVPSPVVIYGWHKLDGKPIQPVYNGHGSSYADYSHGIRLVSTIVFVNGEAMSIREVLKSPKWSNLLSNEGVILKPIYTTENE